VPATPGSAEPQLGKVNLQTKGKSPTHPPLAADCPAYLVQYGLEKGKAGFSW